MTQLEFQIDFSNSEKTIASYILNNADDVLNMNIKELATKTYSSPATIVRLCRKLGLEGFGDFKIKLSAELQIENKIDNRTNPNYPFEKNATFYQIASNIGSLTKETITDTLALIDFKNINQPINVLEKADRIFVFGYGNSLISAMEFEHKMSRINKNVELSILAGELMFQAYRCTKKDVAILISYSGETNEIVNIGKYLRKQHIATIGITSVGENELSKYCDYIFNTTSREQIFNKIAPYSSKTSISYILDFLFSCLFKLHYDEYLENKLSVDKEYDKRHPYNSPIDKKDG
jgi:DNA-binding MurR/RpiR family transcriptional regulator